MGTKYKEDDVVEYFSESGEYIYTETIREVFPRGEYDDDGNYYYVDHDTDSFDVIHEDRIIRIVGGPRFIPKWKTTKCHRYNGTKEDYSRYINSHLWKRTKAKILARDNHKCQICGNRGLLHVHHLTYDRFSNENDSDLITLCPDCHDLVHYFGDKAEYEINKEVPTDYNWCGVPLANGLLAIMSEIYNKIHNKGIWGREKFLRICLLTMIGEPKDTSLNIRDEMAFLEMVFRDCERGN